MYGLGVMLDMTTSKVHLTILIVFCQFELGCENNDNLVFPANSLEKTKYHYLPNIIQTRGTSINEV
jgi:hypothetical protein